MTYEAKSISSILELEHITQLEQMEFLITSPGDTFVNTFTFTKTAKTDLEETSQQYNRWCEIVSVKVETTVDLKNRSDLSLSEWDNKYQPKYEEYQKYNRVYSQQPTLVQNSETGFKSKKVQEFDTRIMASKEKIPGESVDSWTDFLQMKLWILMDNMVQLMLLQMLEMKYTAYRILVLLIYQLTLEFKQQELME
jgi:hypothetical protein